MIEIDKYFPFVLAAYSATFIVLFLLTFFSYKRYKAVKKKAKGKKGK